MRTKILLALLVATSHSATVFADCVEDDKATNKSSTFLEHVAASQPASDAANSVSFKISKMSCKSCAAKIRKALKSELGLENVNVDLKTKTVTVACPAESCTRDKVAATLAGAGYPSTPNL